MADANNPIIIRKFKGSPVTSSCSATGKEKQLWLNRLRQQLANPVLPRQPKQEKFQVASRYGKSTVKNADQTAAQVKRSEHLVKSRNLQNNNRITTV